jgi:DNA-directed RNA polymerase specialized sigma24 family protein
VIPFPATHQSVLERIRSDDAGVRRTAFGDLAVGYWRPSYHYLRLHWRLEPDAAEDAVQAFFTAAFEKGYVEKYDPAKARFRTFLRVCLDRFVQNLQKAESAEKRSANWSKSRRRTCATSIGSFATRRFERCSRVPWTTSVANSPPMARLTCSRCSSATI